MNSNPQPNPPIRILLADDHTILRQGLKQLLELDNGIRVCGEAGNGEEAIVQALSLKPDVILMDINMPKVSGYEGSRSILTVWPEARIIILTNQDDPQVLKRFLALGIKGLFLKDVQSERLIEAIKRVAAGHEAALDPELQEKIEEASTRKVKDLDSPLTEREREVLLALTRGHSNQQLADLLVVSPKTVHNHLYSIYNKIGVGSRSEAIVWAIESGFLSGNAS